MKSSKGRWEEMHIVSSNEPVETDSSISLKKKKYEVHNKWSMIKFWASQMALMVENPLTNAGDIRHMGSIPGLRRCPGEGMAAHSSRFAWRITWTEEPGRLQSIGLQIVGHDWSDLAQYSKAQLNIIISVAFSKKN